MEVLLNAAFVLGMLGIAFVVIWAGEQLLEAHRRGVARVRRMSRRG